MKTFLTIAIALAALAPARAQVFGPRAANGLFWGGVAGAVIGNNSGSLGHNAWRGAAYGAGAGLLLGSYGDYSNRGQDRYTVGSSYWYPRTYVYRSSPNLSYYGGYRGYGYPRGRGYGYGSGYGVSYSYSPYRYVGGTSYGRSSYASNGLFLGGITGAIIGRNSGSLGHNAWRGAGYGAAAGYILGAIADHNRERDESAYAPVVVEQASNDEPVTTVASPIVKPTVGQGAAGPMTSANALFGRN